MSEHHTQHVAEHVEGDAHDLIVVVVDEEDRRVDLTNASAEWLLLEDPTDADADALVTKSTANTGEIDLDDPRNGRLIVHLDTGDTDGHIAWADEPDNEVDLHHRLRVTNDAGERATVLRGEFTIVS